MEFINSENIKELANPGVVSRQLINPDNSKSERVTITEVHLEVGASQPRHKHDTSEQIWYAIQGVGKLLLSDEKEMIFKAGDVVRFADNDIHGLFNDGDTEFVYISVTSPPIDFGYAYNESSIHTLNDLWHCNNEDEWIKALNHYWNLLRANQIELERYMDNINYIEIKNLSVDEFYKFLLDKYFVWKYTQPNRLKTTTNQLKKYIKNNDLSTLATIHKKIFEIPKNDIFSCLKAATEIKGLGTAGASGLLSILFPEYFGTVDQFVVERLREISFISHKDDITKMNPESLRIKDGVILINIMREKANELNQLFNTDFWTPRKIDMILWSFGR